MKKIIVTGGAGFIGSHLVDKLLQQKKQVTVIDNYSRGRPENLEQHQTNKQFTLINDKIENKTQIEESIIDADALIHFASISSVYRSITESEEINKVNVTATLKMLDTCIEQNVKRFIFASSATVYGPKTTDQNQPIKEDEPLYPMSPYSASKIAGEAYCKSYYETYGLDISILRFFNIYGQRTTGTYRRVISKIAEAMQKKKPIKICGDGTQTRDFTYREDAIEAILLVLNNKKTINQTYNVGSGIPTTINQLAEHMTKIAGKPDYEIQHISPLKNDAKHKYADITKLKKLGYQPKTNLIEGLTKYLEWFNKDSKLQK